jgi:hypothetical protein
MYSVGIESFLQEYAILIRVFGVVFFIILHQNINIFFSNDFVLKYTFKDNLFSNK